MDKQWCPVSLWWQVFSMDMREQSMMYCISVATGVFHGYAGIVGDILRWIAEVRWQCWAGALRRADSHVVFYAWWISAHQIPVSQSVGRLSSCAFLVQTVRLCYERRMLVERQPATFEHGEDSPYLAGFTSAGGEGHLSAFFLCISAFLDKRTECLQ